MRIEHRDHFGGPLAVECFPDIVAVICISFVALVGRATCIADGNDGERLRHADTTNALVERVVVAKAP
ncbi:hypothetical protein D3C87_1951010 [compost metagenome]